MRITWQRDTDMACVYLRDQPAPGELEAVVCDDKALSGLVNLDLDSLGRILGIEVENASRLLPEEVLKVAEMSGE